MRTHVIRGSENAWDFFIPRGFSLSAYEANITSTIRILSRRVMPVVSRIAGRGKTKNVSMMRDAARTKVTW